MRWSEIILNGSSHVQAGENADDLHELVEHCEIGGCEAFMPHSWQDVTGGRSEALGFYWLVVRSTMSHAFAA